MTEFLAEEFSRKECSSSATVQSPVLPILSPTVHDRSMADNVRNPREDDNPKSQPLNYKP